MTNNQYYLLNQVARLVGVRSYKIAYRITQGDLPEPEMRINNQRAFSAAEVEHVRAFFESRKWPRKAGK